MIRPTDMVRIALRKAFSRKKWAVLTILSLATGVTIIIAASSLIAGVRDLISRTILLDVIDLPAEVIRVHHRDPRNPPPGCIFQLRCPYVMDVCRSEEPPLRELKSRQEVACHLYELSPEGEVSRVHTATGNP